MEIWRSDALLWRLRLKSEHSTVVVPVACMVKKTAGRKVEKPRMWTPGNTSAWVEVKVIHSRGAFKMHLKDRCQRTGNGQGAGQCDLPGSLEGMRWQPVPGALAKGNNHPAVPQVHKKPSAAQVLLEEPDRQLGITWWGRKKRCLGWFLGKFSWKPSFSGCWEVEQRPWMVWGQPVSSCSAGAEPCPDLLAPGCRGLG